MHAASLVGRMSTSTSTSTDTTTEEQEGKRKPKVKAMGAVIFTGPDSLRDHHVKVETHQQYIGHTTASSEITGDLNYICRPSEANLYCTM